MTKSFEEARKTCVRNGGILFEPKNQQQNEEVANAGGEFDENFWWIGVDDKEREGRFQWSSTKDNTTFSNWDVGQPDSYKGNYDCVFMYIHKSNVHVHGKWYDHSCDRKKNFICEFFEATYW